MQHSTPDSAYWSSKIETNGSGFVIQRNVYSPLNPDKVITSILSCKQLILLWEWTQGLLRSSAFYSVFFGSGSLGFVYAPGSFAFFHFKYATFDLENTPIFIEQEEINQKQLVNLLYNIALSIYVSFQYVSIIPLFAVYTSLPFKHIFDLYISYCTHQQSKCPVL